MALKKCDECNALMSERAPTCLNCGYPIATAGQAENTGAAVTGRSAGARLHDMLLVGTFICALTLVGLTVVGI